MSQQVTVSRKIEFVGDANQEFNVTGDFAPARICETYNFTELALDETNKYTKTADAGGAVALASGGITLTTDGTDTDALTYAMGGIWWYPAKKPVCEMTFKVTPITTLSLFAGFTDAAAEATTLLPHGIVTATQTATATNSAGFLFDVLQTIGAKSNLNVVSSLTGGTKQYTQLALKYQLVAAAIVTVRVAVDVAGNANFYINGEQVGYHALATSTTLPLVPYFGIRNSGAAAHVATLRRVRCWCDI
jgi:hypothetical protein